MEEEAKAALWAFIAEHPPELHRFRSGSGIDQSRLIWRFPNQYGLSLLCRRRDPRYTARLSIDSIMWARPTLAWVNWSFNWEMEHRYITQSDLLDALKTEKTRPRTYANR